MSRTTCILRDDKAFITIARNGPDWTDGWAWSIHMATRINSPCAAPFVIGQRIAGDTASFRVLAHLAAVLAVDRMDDGIAPR